MASTPGSDPVDLGSIPSNAFLLFWGKAAEYAGKQQHAATCCGDAAPDVSGDTAPIKKKKFFQCQKDFDSLTPSLGKVLLL